MKLQHCRTLIRPRVEGTSYHNGIITKGALAWSMPKSGLAYQTRNFYSTSTVILSCLYLAINPAQ